VANEMSLIDSEDVLLANSVLLHSQHVDIITTNREWFNDPRSSSIWTSQYPVPHSLTLLGEWGRKRLHNVIWVWPN